MKAAVLQDVGRLEVVEMTQPECGPDEILVRVEACGICESDLKLVRHGHDLVAPPRVLGHEVAGTVVEVGENVHGFYASERVAISAVVPCGVCYYCTNGKPSLCDAQMVIGYNHDGGLCELLRVPSRAIRMGCVNKVPDGLPLDLAALAQPLASCIHAQEASGVGLGKTVLVLGAGPLGCMNVLLARASGAVNLVLACSEECRLTMAADVCSQALLVDVDKQDLTVEMLSLTDRRGADVVLVTRPERKLIEAAFGLVAKGGVIDFFSGLPKNDPVIQLDVNLMRTNQFSVVGSHGAGPRHHALALQVLASGRIHTAPFVAAVFSLDQVPAAIESIQRGEVFKALVKPQSAERSST